MGGCSVRELVCRVKQMRKSKIKAGRGVIGTKQGRTGESVLTSGGTAIQSYGAVQEPRGYSFFKKAETICLVESPRRTVN